jgi:serine/threonine-protein kinase
MTEVEEAKTAPGAKDREKSSDGDEKAPESRRGAAISSDPRVPEAPVSIRKLASPPDEPPPPSMSRKEREEIAKKRVGATVKGWRLARLLGVGPICAAYESFRGADDSGEHVVLKLMVGNIAKHERARAMFLRGAYASNRFTHPRVVSVSGDGTDADGAPLVVRPWVDAEPLEQVVQKSEGGIEQAQLLRIAEQVLDALEIAHSHGIVHGAITPRNILVTPRGSVRLCDFSIPPGMGPRASDEEDVLATRRVGDFSAPERCGDQPKAASEQTDLYMLAACLYYAVSKEMPRGNSADLASTPARRVREVAPKVSEHVAQIIDHALGLEPEARFESAYAMLGDVRRAMAGRRPKLGDARRPVPSGSFSALPVSIREGPVSSSRLGTTTLRSEFPPSGRGRRQWRGNLALILAIALLVGVATFVM